MLDVRACLSLVFSGQFSFFLLLIVGCKTNISQLVCLFVCCRISEGFDKDCRCLFVCLGS